VAGDGLKDTLETAAGTPLVKLKLDATRNLTVRVRLFGENQQLPRLDPRMFKAELPPGPSSRRTSTLRSLKVFSSSRKSNTICWIESEDPQPPRELMGGEIAPVPEKSTTDLDAVEWLSYRGVDLVHQHGVA
jgi:hypothetical protein